MRRYSKISTSLWVSSQKWRKLGHDDLARLLYFYLHTCTHANTIGTYVLPLAYVCTDMGWSEQQVKETIAKLEAAGLVVYDDAESVVHIPGAMSKDPPTNAKHAKGMATEIHSLPAGIARNMCVLEFKEQKHYDESHGVDTLSIPYQIPFQNSSDTPGTGKGKGTGTVQVRNGTEAAVPPLPPPPNAEGGQSTGTETEGSVTDDTQRSTTTSPRRGIDIRAHQAQEKWIELGLPLPDSVPEHEQLEGLSRLFTNEQKSWKMTQVCEAMEELARDPPEWAWAIDQGPGYLSARPRMGKSPQVIETVLKRKARGDRGGPPSHQSETADDRAARIIGVRP